MLGNIYTRQKCPVCGQRMVYDERRGNCFCESHRDIPASGGYYLKFKGLNLSFSRSIRLAEQTLNGMRAKEAEGYFDQRDYQKSRPLGFMNLIEGFLDIKRREVGYSQFKDIEKALYRGAKFWGNQNIKGIQEAEIEDFIFADHRVPSGDPISSTTRAHIRSAIHQFFKWVCRRDRSIRMPEIPHVNHKKKYRDVVSIAEQQNIIQWIHDRTIHLNPKIWLAIHILSHNSDLRPSELLKVCYGHIMPDLGVIVIREPKEGDMKGKYAKLWPEEVALIALLPRSLPLTRFFVHPKGVAGVRPGTPMHTRVLNQWIQRAKKDLGICTNATLYSVTRHSTITAMSSIMSPEQIRRGGTTHSSKAMDRYLIPNADESKEYQDNVRLLQKGSSKKEGLR